ncbi:MAG: hypothetical protein UDS46_09125 [Bacteroidales bacterium]|nr:hypothetical protein [Bacteroidales bacterium]
MAPAGPAAQRKATSVFWPDNTLFHYQNMAGTCETTARLHKPVRQQSRQDKRQKTALHEIWTPKTSLPNKEGSLKNRLPTMTFKISAAMALT